MQRNLLRHLTWRLPSGQDVARAVDTPRLAAADLDELRAIRTSFVASTPLFYYILKEGDLIEDGARLGPVGRRVIGEVFIGLLPLDRQSYLAMQPEWRPTLPASGSEPETCRLADLLTFARGSSSRGQ